VGRSCRRTTRTSTFRDPEQDATRNCLTSRRWGGSQWKGLFGCEMMWSIGVQKLKFKKRYFTPKVLSCLSSVSSLDSAFLLLSFLFSPSPPPVNASFHPKRTAQESLIPAHHSIPSCILLSPIPVSPPTTHLLEWKWKFIRPPSPILADLVMLAILPLLLTSPPTPNPILTNSPHSSHPTIMATQNLTSHLLPLTQRLYKSLPSLL
jgi:hypothetical protein